MATQRISGNLPASICSACRHQRLAVFNSRRAFSSAARTRADNPFSFLTPGREAQGQQKSDFLSVLDRPQGDRDSMLNEAFARNMEAANEEPHRLHVYATKHNTHITFVQPPRLASQTASSSISGTSGSATEQKKMVDVLLSLSTGNIGFRKGGRGSFDAAFQLSAFALKQMREKGMLRDVRKIAVVLRGFGAGREAVTKSILGTEGRLIRPYIISVTDATRLKFGGTRSKKPRRLG